MRTRLFGNTGLRVSEFFLGTMSFGAPDTGTEGLDTHRRVLDAYAEAGGNTLDTANFYQDGRGESTVGELLAGRRDEFVLASKYTGPRSTTDPNAAGSHRKNLRLSLEQSLRRLGTDYLDIYWVHIWDRHTPVEETMRALDDAVTSGKVLYVGISDAPAWVITHANTLADWRGWTPFAGVQAPYSLLRRDVERELLPMAERFGLTLAAWGALAHGALAGAGTAGGPEAGAGPGADTGRWQREQRVRYTLKVVAEELDVPPAQVALAWLHGRSHAVHPILGAATPGQLAENLEALALELPAEARARLDAASDIALGFPADFITTVGPDVFPQDHARLDARV
ncbi:aldo/keto reductase [Streptomyces monticola]|uniref:Aldo/keto reductase n=1 Tax=Streptomyces monticola TaxID=2666263 RepID=A0ABW2JEN7_9ACTN